MDLGPRAIPLHVTFSFTAPSYRQFYLAHPSMQHLITTPHYHILADSNYDASGTPYHYIPTEDLEAAAGTNLQISAPEVDNFFEGFKNGKHIPRPWLKDRYPLD